MPANGRWDLIRLLKVNLAYVLCGFIIFIAITITVSESYITIKSVKRLHLISRYHCLLLFPFLVYFLSVLGTVYLNLGNIQWATVNFFHKY